VTESTPGRLPNGKLQESRSKSLAQVPPHHLVPRLYHLSLNRPPQRDSRTIMPSKYEAAHKDPSGPDDARPTALQIVQDEELAGKLSGKVFVVTGCSSGIGVETAKALASTGATLYLTARNLPAAEKALEGILEPGRVEILEMDLTSSASVKLGASAFLKKSSKLNVLICNAGVMAIPKLTLTEDGFETQFATNHLYHFLLFQLLKDSLLSSSTPSFNSRVILVSSCGHRGGGIRLDDYNFRKRPEEYNPWNAYSQSKTANIYMANEIERRYGSRGLHGISLMPGSMSTGLQRHLDPVDAAEYANREIVRKYMKTTEQGAATTVLAAISKEFENKGGVYLENCQVVGLHPIEGDFGEVPDVPGYSKHAFDEEKARQLWADSLKMVTIAED
jgi:NAD(P)-dependent dehydrogenase (short-subunit alcohol dehydrogenase family)